MARDQKKKEEGKDNTMFKEYNEFMASQKDQGPLPVYTKDGTVRQANQGKYEWRFDESDDKTQVIFEIKIPKFMDTALINVDLQPTYLRLDIKGRITQLSIPEDVIVEKSKVQRSQTTGVLQLTMPKAQVTTVEAQQMRIKKRLEERAHAKKLRELEKKQQEAKEAAEKQRAQKLAQPEDYDNKNFLIRETELESERIAREEAKKKKFYEEFQPDFDIDEVPPLE